MRMSTLILSIILFTSCSSKTDQNKDNIDTLKINSEVNGTNDNVKDLDSSKYLQDSIINKKPFVFEEKELADKFFSDTIFEVESIHKIFDTDCKDWNYPDKTQLTIIIENMKWQFGSDIHYMFSHYPCQLSGFLKSMNGKKYKYYLNAAGYISITGKDGSFFLGMEDKKFEKFFFDIKFTQEEFEENNM